MEEIWVWDGEREAHLGEAPGRGADARCEEIEKEEDGERDGEGKNGGGGGRMASRGQG